MWRSALTIVLKVPMQLGLHDLIYRTLRPPLRPGDLALAEEEVREARRVRNEDGWVHGGKVPLDGQRVLVLQVQQDPVPTPARTRQGSHLEQRAVVELVGRDLPRQSIALENPVYLQAH